MPKAKNGEYSEILQNNDLQCSVPDWKEIYNHDSNAHHHDDGTNGYDDNEFTGQSRVNHFHSFISNHPHWKSNAIEYMKNESVLFLGAFLLEVSYHLMLKRL